MSKNPATCPGLSQFMRPTPSYMKCSRCGADVEIWSDEEQTQCQTCGTTVMRGKIQSCLDWCEYADKCRSMIEAKKKSECDRET